MNAPRRLTGPLALLLAMALLATAFGAGAVQVHELFQVKVPVAGQDQKARSAAVQEAIKEVLVRASGQGDTAKLPAAESIIGDADQYVQQFRYVDNSGDQGGQSLWVKFDSGALRRAMEKQGLPYWDEDRPQIVVWLALERNGERDLVNGDQAPEAAAALRAAAQRRAVPLLFPLLDIEDRRNVAISDVWGGFREPVVQASKRYGSDAVLAGQVYQQAGQWHGRWNFYWQGNDRSWPVQADQLNDVLAAGIEGAADVLGTHLAVMPGHDTGAELTLRVTGVDTLADYAAVEKYFTDVGGVGSALPIRVQGDQVLERLSLVSSPDRVLQIIDAGNRLVRAPGPQPTTDDKGEPVYVYRLQR